MGPPAVRGRGCSRGCKTLSESVRALLRAAEGHNRKMVWFQSIAQEAPRHQADLFKKQPERPVSMRRMPLREAKPGGQYCR